MPASVYLQIEEYVWEQRQLPPVASARDTVQQSNATIAVTLDTGTDPATSDPNWENIS